MQHVTELRRRRALVRACLTLTACVTGLIGCDRAPAQYRLSLRVEDGALVRTLEGVPSKSPDGSTSAAAFEAAENEALRRIYGEAKAQGAFTGRFADRLPADLGGSGALDRHRGPLGTLYTYRERMRGEDAPLEFAARVQSGVSGALALTEGWTPNDAVSDPAAAAALAAWVRERFISDVANLVLLRWLQTAGLLSEDEFELRAVQFLDERGYFAARSSLELDFEELWGEAIPRAMQERGIAVDAALRAQLEDDDALVRSLTRHVARSEPFRIWLSARTPQPDEEPLPEGAIDALLRQEESPAAEVAAKRVESFVDERLPELAMLGELVFPASPVGRVDVALALSTPPIETNGTWRAELGRIEWDSVPMRTDRQLSALLYATWAEPAASYQLEHFGRTLLTGARLLEYERWRESLDAEPRSAWDALVDALRPDDDLRARIDALRLPGSGPEGSRPVGADLLIEGLEEPAAP